jgi:hypothetical protein
MYVLYFRSRIQRDTFELALIDAVTDTFRVEIATPARSHHAIKRAGETLLLVPGWTKGAV